MTRRDTLQCVHEPFGDAYYFGPERLHERYEADEDAREATGYSDSTYKTVFDVIAEASSEVGYFHLLSCLRCFLLLLHSPRCFDVSCIQSRRPTLAVALIRSRLATHVCA